MVQDIRRQFETPPTGEDRGKQSMVDFNLYIDGVFYLPVGTTNTLNGGKDREGAIRITNGRINVHRGGNIWDEYLPSTESPAPDGIIEVGNVTVNNDYLATVSPVFKVRINGNVIYQGKFTGLKLGINRELHFTEIYFPLTKKSEGDDYIV